jgi:hypothetical protein
LRLTLARAGFVIGAAVAAVALLPATAQTPPFPDFFYPYGQAQSAGANLDPAVQPVLAFVNGTLCGSAMTQVATEGADAGKTVYVVNVLHDGTGPGQRPGCGHAGDPVTLYFPQDHRLGSTTATFQPGSGSRVDQNLVQLPFRLPVPLSTRD